MANSLHRQIEKNEVIVVKESYYQGLSIEGRAFRCESGFGLQSDTMGQAIYGHWLDGTGYDFIYGTEVSQEDTEQYQQEHGKLHTEEVLLWFLRG